MVRSWYENFHFAITLTRVLLDFLFNSCRSNKCVIISYVVSMWISFIISVFPGDQWRWVSFDMLIGLLEFLFIQVLVEIFCFQWIFLFSLMCKNSLYTVRFLSVTCVLNIFPFSDLFFTYRLICFIVSFDEQKFLFLV